MSPGCPGGTFPYTIVAGDTCYALAQRFGTTVTAIQAANPGINCNNLQIGQTICIFIEPSTVTCPPGSLRYSIQPGDTFGTLAYRFSTTVQAIMAANPGANSNNLQVGQKICIPVGTVPSACPGGFLYTIVAGDNFYNIAIRYHTTVAAIMAANPGLNPNSLRIGQQICVPVR